MVLWIANNVWFNKYYADVFHKIVGVLPGFKMVTLLAHTLILANCYMETGSSSLLILVFNL
jgi:hypothetical protein